MSVTPDPYKRLDEAVERLQELTEEAVGLVAEIKRRTMYHGLQVGGAILEHLRSQNAPIATGKIAREIWEGGVTTTSDFDTFSNTVKLTLDKLRNDGQIHYRIGSGWRIACPRTEPPRT